ncbi:MAG: NAD(P)-dependent oxidoreductase [Alphaproteobacteria bacterium]|nr:NAD(P)-dependent oxidoreductase [Alphaproteobacteria bacterium]
MIRKVGFIGLGTMGRPMVRNLLKKQFQVHGFDVAAAAVAGAVGDGAVAAASPKAVAEVSDAVVTMLPDYPHVHEVISGADGLARAGRKGLVLINTSTISPRRSRDLAAEAEAQGLVYLEVPVTKGVRAAIAGTLTLFVGGAEATLEAVRPVLEALGSEIFYTGPHGTASTVKLANNMCSIGGAAIVAEAVAMAAKGGVSPRRLLEFLQKGSGDSHTLREKLPRMIARDFVPGFAVEHAFKDIGLALETAADVKSAMPVTAAVRQALGLARLQGKAAMDNSSLVTVYEGANPITDADK